MLRNYAILMMLLPFALKGQEAADTVVCDTIATEQYIMHNSQCTIDSINEINQAENRITIDGISAIGDSLDYKGKRHIETIYAFPEATKQLNFQHRDWKRMWINSATLTGAFVASLVVMETLPDNTTAWSRAEIRSTPFYKRWSRNIFKRGFEWDSDNPVFNLVLHPYAGAVYFMSARSCGFSFWGSLLVSASISTIGWELGIEACNERPSIQDIFVTPLVGSAIGEGFFRLKYHIVNNDYRLFGSPVLGNVVAFLIDPVNEVVGLFAGNPARKYAKARRMQVSSAPTFGYSGGAPTYGFTLQAVF